MEVRRRAKCIWKYRDFSNIDVKAVQLAPRLLNILWLRFEDETDDGRSRQNYIPSISSSVLLFLFVFYYFSLFSSFFFRLGDEIEGTDKAVTRSDAQNALNLAIKTSAHVYYFIQFPKLPQLKRIHNYRRLREPLNLSRVSTDSLGPLCNHCAIVDDRVRARRHASSIVHACIRTNVIYACVDFNSHAMKAYHEIVRAHDCGYTCPTRKNYPCPFANGSRYAQPEIGSMESLSIENKVLRIRANAKFTRSLLLNRLVESLNVQVQTVVINIIACFVFLFP